MDEPVIHSSSWTGPLQMEDPLKDTAAAIGTRSVPTDPERAKWAKPAAPMSPELRRWGRLAGLVLLSPLLLLASWYFAHAATRDEFWSDHREWLILWGVAAICVFAREIHAGRPLNAGPRSGFLALVLSSTAAFASWYAYVAVTSHSDAIPSRPAPQWRLWL